MEKKECTKCKVSKTTDNFNKKSGNSGRLESQCKECIKNRNSSNKGRLKADTVSIVCKECKEDLPVNNFTVKPNNPTGRTTVCKTCYNNKHKEYRESLVSKMCSKCRQEKPINNFVQDLTLKGGRRYSCIECESSNKIATVTEKICTKCEQLKPASAYHINPKQKTGLSPHCIECTIKDQKEYFTNNIDKVREINRRSSKNRRQSLKKTNPRYFADYNINKRLTDIQFKIKCNLRSRVNNALKGTVKSVRTLTLLGCTIPELKQHLEAKFLPTMTWDNYGSLWHIDHKVACIKFDLTDPEQQKQCFHYSNLQPLFAVTTTIDGVTYLGNLNKQDLEVDNIVLNP